MSEIRQDPTTEEWVIISKERAKRPHDFKRPQARAALPLFLSSCPFCPGNEAMTPEEVLSYPDEGRNGWRVRVFSNRFPALSPEGATGREAGNGSFRRMDGMGVHEVIVETPEHNRPLALMQDGEVEKVLAAYQERYIAVSRLPFVKMIMIFKNHGPSAGTSLEHPHSQLIATPVVPKHIRKRNEVALRHYDNTGQCLYAHLAEQEVAADERVVMETGRFIVFHPFASHRPFETWIVPKGHQASFGNASPEELQDLAKVLRITLLKLYRGLNDPDFNFVIDSAAGGDENQDYHLWHLRIVPRLGETAGFEMGSGMYINTALPEETARFIRKLEVE